MDCHEPVDEAHLVRICIEGTLREYRVHLVNLNFQTFSQLIEAAINLKSTIKGSPWKTGRSSSSQVSAASASSNRKSQGEGSRSSKKRKQYDDPPPYPCTIEEVKALVKEWVADGEITLPEVETLPPKKNREGPNYCVYHRTTKHSTANCWTLRN